MLDDDNVPAVEPEGVIAALIEVEGGVLDGIDNPIAEEVL